MFFWLLFVLLEIIYRIRIPFQLHPPSIFYLSDSVLILLIAIFFTLIFFKFIIIFMISFFNIKLIWNWVYWLSSGLRFHGLWVWRINPGLEDLSEFDGFFFKLMFSQFHHSIFILMRIALRYFFLFSFYRNFH